MFLVFVLKLVLNMTFNLNDLFFRKICNLDIFDLKIVRKLSKVRFLAIFSILHHQFSMILHIMIGGHDVQLFSYNLLVQSMYSCFNWDSLHARLSSHYKASIYKMKKRKHIGKLIRKNLKMIFFDQLIVFKAFIIF